MSAPVKTLLARSGLGPGVRQDIRSLPALELYLPFPRHLQAWRGEALVQVAVPVKRDESYIVYSMDGSSRRYPGDHVPQIPTLVLGPSEIDYVDVESAVLGGNRTGDMMSAGRALRPSFSFGISTAQHTRLIRFSTWYNKDGGFGGSDEVEVFGAMTTWFHLAGSTHKECTRYTGVSANITYNLPNDAARTIATAVPTGTDKVYIHAYEDDNGACVFHRGDDDLYGFISSPVSQYGQSWRTGRDSGADGHIYIMVQAGTP